MKKNISILLFFISISALMQFQAYGRTLNGAGATFPSPLYKKLFSDYTKQTGITIEYNAVGSGEGYSLLKKNFSDFSATDMFLNNNLLTHLGKEVIHIPTCLGGVAITYNLPKNPEILLSPDVISDIFIGKINKWNHPKIQSLNPAVTLPDLYIVTIHRSDISGTTFIFTEFLTKTVKEWEEKIGIAPQIKWVKGVSAKSNHEVSKLVQQISGSIGYQELLHALSNNISTAHIQNSKGNFIKPTLESISLSGNTDIPADTRISLVNTDAPYGYPISSFTWLVIYKDLAESSLSLKEAKELKKLLWWITHDGQKKIEEMGYSPLHKKVIKLIESNLNEVTFNKKKLPL
jgi:phosphate transport system substrate-binding protein